MVTPPHAPLELLTPDEMARADALAPRHGRPLDALMDAAGWAVAHAALPFGPCRTLVLCGPGNNGGDGYVAARLLERRGWPVEVAALAPPRAGSEAATAAAAWRGPTVPFDAQRAARAGLVIDAVFGAGLTRDVPDEVADALAAASRVLAVDVPSGLDGATGRPRGRVRAADATVTFVRRKPGHLLMPGRTLCGRVVLADIGMPAAVLADVAPRTWENAPGLWNLPRPGPASHKYTRGHVTVLGGAEMTGAARLAAGAARRGGAGLVTIAALGSADVYRAGEPGTIVSDAPLDEQLRDTRREVWVCGPGLGQDAARRSLPALLAAGRRVVADADALGAHAGRPEALHAGRPEALRGCAVLTPHEGEFAKLFGPVGDSKPDAVRQAAARTGAVVLLKGADTCVAAPDGRCAINASAPPWLATAGAGDVLAGLIAALLAQGMAAWEAACAGVWLHGQAAVRAGAGLVAEDLLPQLARAVAKTTLRA